MAIIKRERSIQQKIKVAAAEGLLLLRGGKVGKNDENGSKIKRKVTTKLHGKASHVPHCKSKRHKEMDSTRGNLSTIDVTRSTNDDIEVKQTIQFNIHGLAVGPGARNFNKNIGKLVETLVPIKFKGWHHVTDNYKEDVWNGLKREYDIPNYVKKSVHLKMPEYYRRFKADLRKNYLDKYPTIEEQEKHVPNGVREEDWKEFVRYESTPEVKAIRAQNAKNKKASKYVWGVAKRVLQK